MDLGTVLLMGAAAYALGLFWYGLILGRTHESIWRTAAYPFLAIVFIMATVDVFTKAHLSTHGSGGIPTFGAFLIEVGAAFGYAAGWNPYAANRASEYSR